VTETRAGRTRSGANGHEPAGSVPDAGAPEHRAPEHRGAPAGRGSPLPVGSAEPTGGPPVVPPEPSGTAPSGTAGPGSQPDVYTLEEVAKAAGCDVALVRDLHDYGLLVANASVGGVAYFDRGALTVARTGARFAALGVEPRHLRAWRNAADREASLFEQLVMPLLRQRNPQARRQAASTLDELSNLGATLRAELIREALRAIR